MANSSVVGFLLLIGQSPAPAPPPSGSGIPAPLIQLPLVRCVPSVSGVPSMSSAIYVSGVPSLNGALCVGGDPSVTGGPTVSIDPPVGNGTTVSSDPPVSNGTTVSIDPPVGNGTTVSSDPSVSNGTTVSIDPPVGNGTTVSSDPPVSNGTTVGSDPSVRAIPPSPKTYPTMPRCGDIDMSENSPLRRYPGIQWVLTDNTDIEKFEGRTVVGGYEEDDSPLWVIRGCVYGALKPGKFSTRRKVASVRFIDETGVYKYEVLLAEPGSVRWNADAHGRHPSNAIPVGMYEGAITYIGRAKYKDFLIIGEVDARGLYTAFNRDTTYYNKYEVLVGDHDF